MPATPEVTSMDTTCVGVWFIQVCHISSHGVSQQYSLPVSCSCGVPPSFLFDHQMKAKKPRPSSGHHHAQPMKLKGEWTLLVASVAHVAANGDASATLAALVASLRQFAASESLLAFDAQTAALRSVAHALATLRSAKTLSSADAATLYRIIADVAIPVFCDAFFCAQEQAARTVLLSIYSRIIESDKVLMPLLEIDASYVPLSQLVKSDFESRLSAFLALTSTTSAATSATDYSDIGKCCSILLNTLEWSVGLAVVTSKLSPMISSLVTLLTRVKREIDVTGLNDDALLLSQKTRACYDILRTIAALFAKLGSSDISERNAAKEVFSFLEMDPAWKEAANQLLQDCIQITFSDPRIYVRDCQFMGGIVTCWLLETLFPAADSAWIQPVFFNGKLDTSSNAIQILTKVVRESIESPDRFHSLLCFIRGILTTLNTKILSISSTSDSNPLFPHLYSLIIQVIDTSSDAPTRILAFKTLASWMCVLRDAVKSEVPLPSQEFVMNAVLKQCFDFVFTFWEDPVDSMMHKLKDVFGFMLEIVKLLRDGKEADGDPASFLRDIVDSLLNADWLRKVKYDLLAHLLTVVSPYEILSLRADFLTLCFDAMNTVSISSRISAFLIRFFAALFDDTAVCLDHLQSAIWINPLCHALTHPSVALRSALSESFLSTVFSGKRTHFQLLLATLQSSNNPHISTAYHLHASICVLKIGKTLGFLPADFFLAPATREFSNHVVTIAITHPDANVRADVCGLLCDSNRALAEPTGEELTYMRQFLGANGADSVSEFRMKLFGGVHKLICRMRRCLYANERDLVQAMKRGNEAEAGSVRERIEMKSSFLRWLMEFAVLSLSPGSSFPRITSALVLLTTIRDAEEISLDSTFNRGLSDQFNTFSNAPCALALTSLLLNDTYEPNRQSAFSLLMSMKGEIPGFGDVQIQLLIEDAIQMLYSVKSSDSDGGASILRLVFCKYIASEPHKRLRISTDYEAINATHSAPAAFVVQLLSLLRRHVNIAEKDLAASISAHPMHGLFLALASILREVKYHNIKEKAEIETWNRILLDAYDLVHTATKTVLVVLSNESPEGNYPGLNPEENGVGGGEDFDAVIGEGGGDTVSKSQRILHECFRTVKEACSALQVVLCKPPLPREGNEVQFVKLDTIVAAGDWLRLLLTSIRHFGAFSGVYTCFHCLCATLLCSKIPSLVTLPQGWLEEFLHKAEVMDVSITRRSGGLPLGVLGVLSANSPYRTSLLEKTMKRLFEAAKAALPLDADTNLDLPQVHAYNIIRRLLSDATITDLMRDYFSDCFVLCIDGLSSQSFPIRNCATMLFSSLVTKVLGVKKNRDEDHAINTVTGREFFARFPSLHAFMIQKLTAAVYELEGENYSVHPAFYPILTILARLKPTTVEGNNTHLTLSTFRPLVLKCAASSFYKVREITARAYASLIPPAEFVDEVHHLMTSIQSNSPSSTHPNLIHGILMIVRNLVQVHLHRDVAGTDILLDFASKIPALMRTSIWILTDLNIPAIQDAYISFIRDFLAKRDWLPTASSLNNPLVQVYIKESWSISVQLLHHYDMTDLKLAHAWIFNLRKNLAQYILECLGPLDTSFESKSAIILRFLCDVDYEVQLEALQHLSLAVFAESVEWSRILPKLLEMVHSKSSYEQVTYVAAEILASEAIREHFRSCSFASVKSVPAGSVADDLAERLSVTENTYEVAALLPLLTTLVVERDDGGGEAGVQVLVGLMRKWSFDETATYVRASVAKSLYVLLSKFSGALSQNVASELLYVDLLLLLDQLLDDDDADVRAVAAKIAAEHLNSKTPIVPLQCRSLLFKYALRSVSSLPAISKVAEYALQILAGSIDPVIVLEAQLNPSHVLFAKEEFNQNKEEIIDAVLAYQVLMAAVGHTAVTLQAKESLYKRVMEWSQSTVATLAATGSKLSTLKGQGKVFGLLMRTVISLVFACSFSDNSRAQTLMKQVASMDVHEQVLRIAKSGSMDAFDGFIPV